MSNDDKIIKYIMLSQMKGIGPVTQNSLLKMFGDIDSLFALKEENMRSAGADKVIGEKRLKLFLQSRDDKDLFIASKQILTDSVSKNVEVITHEDERFPLRFANISDMPVVLYIKGDLRINDHHKSVGIVGARRCTSDGKNKAIMITTESVNEGTAIISGIAKGIDSYAHTAAIKSHGYTIAVLGNGVDICYPQEHSKLYEQIMVQGCVLSEYPPGTKPREYLFPQRNRLIAALSDMLYVVDVGRNSGTKSTIKNASRYGRQVIAVS